MAFALFPIGAVGLSTVEGVSAYWVDFLPDQSPFVTSTLLEFLPPLTARAW